MKTRRKKSEKTKLKTKLMKLVKEKVKERDKNICQKCGKKVYGGNCHASHVIPVSKGMRLAFSITNMKVLCYHCHINWWHKNPIEARNWFKEKFPERYEQLLALKDELVNWSEEDYKEMISDLEKI